MLIFMYSHGKIKISSPYSIKLLIFVTDMRRVYCAVRTKSLNIIQIKFGPQIVKDAINMPIRDRESIDFEGMTGWQYCTPRICKETVSNKEERRLKEQKKEAHHHRLTLAHSVKYDVKMALFG